MSKKKKNAQILWMGLLLVSWAGLASAQDPDLVGHWSFDEDASDSSGNGLNGTLMGGAEIVPGLFGGAVDLGGNPDYVRIDGYQGMSGAPAITVTAWVKTTGNGAIFTWGQNGVATRYSFRINASKLRFEHNAGNILGNTIVSDGEWHHVACANRAGASLTYPEIRLYLDGDDDTANTADPDVMNFNPGPEARIGSRAYNNDRFLNATIDEVSLYSRELTPEEIKQMARRPKSYAPDPANEGSYTGDFAILTWKPGGWAVQHDVYFGADADEVAAGTGDTYKGRQPNQLYFVQSATPGMVYYWRIDDVDLDGTVRTGDVWSFKVTPLVSHDPVPASNATYVVEEPTLSWSAGAKAILNEVYFSDSFSDVNDGAEAANKGRQQTTSFAPGTLTNGATYYWRVDAVEPDLTTIRKGEVLSFTVRPANPAVTDPDLKAWFKMDEGVNGTTVFDSSGHGVHGEFVGSPQFVAEGYAGGALELELGSYVRLNVMDVNSNNVTVSGWMYPYGIQPTWASVLQHRGNITCGLNIKGGMQVAYHWANNALSYQFNSGLVVPEDEWSFLAMVVEENKARLYLNSVDNYMENHFGHIVASWESQALLGGDYNNNAARGMTGLLDDVRVYERSLTPEELAEVMRADLRLAWNLSPTGGLVADRDVITQLSWNAGDGAQEHDVYLAMDRDAVKAATADDTSGIYQGRQSATTYTPAGGFLPGQTYYWRIDEVAGDGSLAKGSVRSFTVTAYLIVDDFESYSSLEGEQIWQSWLDGFGGNETGSRVDYEDENGFSILETANVNSGRQAMPFQYTNDGSFVDFQLNPVSALYSEATLLLDPAQDWTRHDSTTLALSLAGESASPTGSIYDSGSGVYTVTGAGNNLASNGDHFHFLYTTLSGNGTLIAKVDAIEPNNASSWAKIGIMFRESLDPMAAFAVTSMQPIGRVQLQGRAAVGEGASATNSADGSVQLPVWIRLTRENSMFRSAYSLDGSTWVETYNETFGPAEMWVSMGIDALVGLSVTPSSNNPDITVTGTYSEVTLDGAPVQFTDSADIGLAYNSSEDLYVIVEDSSGKTATVNHPANPMAVNNPEWTPWFINLADDVASQGVNLKSVAALSVGIGDKAEAGGKGKVLVDDIRLYADDTLPDPNE